jgi:hypothetical protein
VQFTSPERPQDQHVERALQQVHALPFFRRHRDDDSQNDYIKSI